MLLLKICHTGGLDQGEVRLDMVQRVQHVKVELVIASAGGLLQIWGHGTRCHKLRETDRYALNSAV